MPPRRQPVSIVRARPTEEPDALQQAAAEQAPPAVAAPRARVRRSAAGPAVKKRATKPTPAAAEGSPVEAAAEPGEPAAADTAVRRASVPRSFLIRADVVDDLRAAVTALGAYKPAAGVRSISDVINPALLQAITELQDEYNHGKKFPRVSRMAAGRPPGSTSGVPTTKVSVLIRADVLEDLRAAVTYLGAYKPRAEIQTSADVLNPALVRRIAELQNEYNHGKKFPRVSRMPTGRPVRG